ncbi:hypothetical protein PV08_05323 [Exophiala spinifera]|uniref:Uncharacterized protein n=1 Tax=Exophiala spinifera TaxID=91928 RepID=A0A0D2B8K4_9EURO|nr:uncharacterized protein PV08_05323 [Exophiala spinifera]KIW15278.1 hypothetical protein PV08_05323 [Exophiala spinifera]
MTAVRHSRSVALGSSNPAAGKTTWNVSHGDLQPWNESATLVDDVSYNKAVLQLTASMSEDDLDDEVSRQLESLGLIQPAFVSALQVITSSLSTVTVASDSINQSPIHPQSPDLKSSPGNDHHPVTRSSHISDHSPTQSNSPSSRVNADKGRNSPLKRGLKRLSGFRRRRSGSAALVSPTLTSLSSTDTHQSELGSIDMRNPLSIRSSKSSWSPTLPTSKHSYDEPPPIDQDALKRSMESQQLMGLRMTQLEEKVRFLEFQTTLISQLRTQKEHVKKQRQVEHERILSEQSTKNEEAVEALEARQLEEELKMQKEHELEKRAVMVRLRHMEAYCHTSTPPPDSISPGSGRSSIDSALPERKVTDKDYHSLAQQYRERDVMDTLHSSKINVLRGRQKKAVEKMIAKKETELKKMEEDQAKELQTIDQSFTAQEAQLRLALGVKRTRLENRWKTQALIERTKLEKATGLPYAPLPDVIAVEDPVTTDLTLSLGLSI